MTGQAPVRVSLDPATIEALADQVVERLAASPLPALVDADAVARHLNVERSFVYEHAAELGARRLGEGPKARLRFSLEDVDAAISCSLGRESEQSPERMSKPVRRRRRARPLGTDVALLPIRGSKGRES